MTEWWEALSSLGRVFACMAIPATIILLIQTILSIVGMSAGESDADSGGFVDLDGDGIPDVPEVPEGIFGEDSVVDVNEVADSGFRLLSLRSIIAFLTIFGWVGLIVLKNGLSSGWALFIALISGLIAMFAVAGAMWFMLRLQSDGTRNIRNALGKSGTVYLYIPASRNGFGKVNLLLQDTYVELNAVTDEEENIPSGREIVVIGLSGQNTLVVKSK